MSSHFLDFNSALNVSGLKICELHEFLMAQAQWPIDVSLIEPMHAPSDNNVWYWIAVNHRNNCLLWAEEDLARRTKVGDSEIAANKRAIDRFNQARNDATERVDEHLLVHLNLVDQDTSSSDMPVSLALPTAYLNSETAGSMIDRMSILSLKMTAMRWQTGRTDVDASHLQASKTKLDRLCMQRVDLAQCLDELIAGCLAGQRYFKVYRQFKMYNDPRFNPVLVKELAKV
jgi:hypothetical protein